MLIIPQLRLSDNPLKLANQCGITSNYKGVRQVIFQAIVLGIVQGLTEFLPISSSAHLVIIPWLFGWTDSAVGSLSFDVSLHLGTLVAIVIFFWKDWITLAGAWFKSIFERKIGDDHNRKMAWFLILASVPGALAGVFFEGKIEELFHSETLSVSPMIVMASIIALLGLVLWLVDRFVKYDRPFEKIGIKDAIIIGCAQALAIFPGVSRSGATITAGRALGLDRISAARFSFLLSAPIIAGAGLKSIAKVASLISSGAIPAKEIVIFPIGLVAAALSGIICIKLLLSFLKKYSFATFAVYRFALAAIVLVVALVR
jgi:undecaprenyl-diphosphatase